MPVDFPYFCLSIYFSLRAFDKTSAMIKRCRIDACLRSFSRLTISFMPLTCLYVDHSLLLPMPY